VTLLVELKELKEQLSRARRGEDEQRRERADNEWASRNALMKPEFQPEGWDDDDDDDDDPGPDSDYYAVDEQAEDGEDDHDG
jgi:hypothetical protein